MPLPEDFFDTPLDTAYTRRKDARDIFPDFGEEDVEEKGSAYDAIGEFLWSTGAHFVSGGTMGLTEFVAPTKAWEEKTTPERMGAAVGEALGFFVPMKAIGMGVRGTMALGKSGSKRIAKEAIKKSVSKVDDAAFKTAATKGLTKSVFSKEGKRLLYQHELGGEVLERVNKDLMTNTEAALRAGIKKSKLDVDNATIGTIMKSFQEGLQEGRHINSVSSWLHAKIAPKVGAGPVAQWMAKYTGEVAQDAVVLGIQGVASNAIHAAARDDIDLAPGSAFGHALMLSFAFPMIRAFGGGGERRIGEFWGILRAKHGKTDYTKLAAGEDAANNLRGLLRIITGGKRKNLLGKTEWTGKSGESYHVDDFANLNFKNKVVFDDAVDILKQIQGSIGKLDGMKIWGKAYFKDTFLKAGSLGRMASGAFVMNLDMFRDNAAMFRHLPPEEVLTHLLIGGMMSRGKGGWARDPKSRTGDAKAEQINDYYQMMHLLGIDHSKVSDYVRVKNYQDVVMGNHMGLVFDPTAQEVERIFKKYEKIIDTEHKHNRTEKSSKEVNDPVEEWRLLRNAVGLMREDGYDQANYNILTKKEKSSLREELKRVIYKDKSLKDVSYNRFMQEFSLEQAETSGKMYTSFLERLQRESYEGAGDKVLDGFLDNQGKLNHGGILWEHESSDIAELRDLLYVLENNGRAIKISEQFETTNFSENPKALARLERLSQEFREQQKQMGLGEGVEFTFHLGNPESNPFLREWLHLQMTKGQSRIADIVTKSNTAEMERGDSGFMDVIAREFADVDGAILFPTKYRVVSAETGEEISDTTLQDQIFGIASALYEGAPKTRRFDEKGEVTIEEGVARQIVGAYEGLNLSIPAENLKHDAHLEYIRSRAYEKVDKREENIRVIRKLEEEKLAVVNREEGVVLVNSDVGIRMIADKEGGFTTKQIEELVASHREIIGTLGNNIEQAPGVLEFTEPGALTNVESLHAIRKMLPGIYEKEVRTKVMDILDNPERITLLDKETLQGELDILTENLKVKNYEGAFKSLENLRKKLPGFEDAFEKIYERIVKNQDEELPLELETFELSKGSGNVYKAMQEYVASEKLASQAIEKYLIQLVYRGGDFRSISDYNRLVDNLLVSIGAGTEKIPMDQLFETYLQKNSYESLQQLMHGINQLHSGRKVSNEIDNTHLIDAMEQMFQNYADAPSKTKISIARNYGLLDPNGDISPLTVERLRASDFESIKKNIAPDKLTDRVDEDLFYLGELIRTSREQKMVRLTETILEDGTSAIVREWIMPWDNVEVNTPANKALDIFAENRVEVYPISKSGVIRGWQQQEISSELNSKIMFENNSTIDVPESKYLTDIIKAGGQLTHEDAVMRDLEMPVGPMKYVEVSLGRPLVLVENDVSLEALDNMYRSWYEAYRIRPEFENNPQQKRNFERVFDPDKVTDNEMKVRAMYHSMLNADALDKIFTSESIESMSTDSGIINDLSNKLLKYSKLGEGGSLKPLPDVERLRLIIDNLSDLPADRRASIENLITEITENEQGITSAFYSDKVEGMENPLSVRTRHMAQLDNIQDPALREHLRERYAHGEESRFKSVMDVPSIDGAQYIDTDMRNLFLSVLAEADYSNGFKGSISKSGSSDLINLYGKGLFIYDPVVAAAMEAKGVRILMGDSSAKNFSGEALSGNQVSGRVSESLDLPGDIANLSNDNIMRIPLESINIRYGGHLSNNSPVPHPYTHYMPENLVLSVRDGWQMLGTKIGEIKRFGRALNMAANEELALVMRRHQEQSIYETDAVSFAESMLNMGLTTHNPVLREAVMKMWEENALPILLKPRNPKFTYPFIIPDLNSAHPIGVDVYKTGDITNPAGHVRIQLGEGTLGEDAKHVPVGSIDELAFSFRSNDIDYLIKYNKKKDKFMMYTPGKEYLDKGHRFNIFSQTGERGGLTFLSDANEIPSELQSFIKHLGEVISSGVPPENVVFGSKTRRPSLAGVQNYIEDVINKIAGPEFSKPLIDNKFNLVHMVERGPRKGMSDFVPISLRIRSQAEKDAGGIGTALGVNALDVRANMQGDHDGDHGRTTHDFGPFGPKGFEGKWEFLKNAYKLAGNNEEYSTKEAGARPLNLYGIGIDNKGDLTHAGSRTENNIYEYKAKMIADQRAVGKIMGLQGSIEWASLGGLSIGNVKLNAKLGYDVDKLLEYGDIYRRFEKGNQSAVDFIKALDEVLVKKSYSYMLNGEGEVELKGKLMELADNSIEMDILYEVIDILRAPNSIFNQEFSEMGGKNATAYDIESHYTDIRKFFFSPNATVFNRLLKKYRKSGVSFEQKLNELVPLFFQTQDGKEVMVSNMADLKSKILKGEAFPNKNIIQFEEQNINELIRKSNVGFVMDEIVKNSMFKSKELDIAWEHVEDNKFSRTKQGGEAFIEEITMLKVLGISQDQMLASSQTAFTVGRHQWLRNAERASLLYDLLGNEESFLTSKLEYQLGFGRHANKEIISGIVDRLDSVAAARNIVEVARKEELLKDIHAKQDKYKVNHKKPRRIRNDDKKPKVIYKYKPGTLYTKDEAGKDVPNWTALKYVGTIQPGRSSKKLMGNFLVLDNPIVGHRLSRESTLEGLTWNFVHNSMPQFVNKRAFEGYEREAVRIVMELKDVWRNAITEFRNNKGQIGNIFGRAERNKLMTLNNYFKSTKFTKDTELSISEQHLIGDLGEEGSLIYYKAKLLLRPDVIPNHYVEGQVELPYMALNNRIFKEVFTWLHNNNQKEVASKLIKEYTDIKNYLSGFTNESTFNLRPSPLYKNKWNVDMDRANETILSILDGVVTPDIEIRLKQKGIGTFEGDVLYRKKGEGGYEIREIRDIFSNWKEGKVDKRISCRQ